MLGKKKRKDSLFLSLFIWGTFIFCADGEDSIECDVGSWGPQCSGVCHCADGDSVCSKKDGQCSQGGCSKGYTGAPFCQTICPLGSYGRQCSSTCHCPEEDTCNHVNGICSSAQCMYGWDGSGCSVRLPVFSGPPNITSTSNSTINVSWRKWNPSVDPGDPPIAQYILQFRKSEETTWNTYETLTVGEGHTEPEVYVRMVTGLEPKAGYVFRLALARYDDDKVGSAFPGPETAVTKACSAPSSPVQDVFATQELQANGLASISLSWKTPDDTTSGCNSFAYYKVVLQCVSDLCLEQEVAIPYPEESYTFRDIRPDVAKDISVDPINDAGVIGPSTLLFAAALNTNTQSTEEEKESTTDNGSVIVVSPDLSFGNESDLQLRSRSENSLELSWRDSGSDKYTITATVVDSYSLPDIVNEVQQKITLTGHSIALHNLHTASQYAIVIASASNTVLYQRTFWTHPSQPPSPSNPDVKSISDTTVTLYIEPIIINTGPLTSYQIVVEEVIPPPTSSKMKSVLMTANSSKNADGNVTLPSATHEKLLSSIDFENLANFQDSQSKGLNHYITAALSSTQVAKGIEFEIGDDLKYGGYPNTPLKPETPYNLWVGILSRLDGIDKRTFVNVSGSHSSEYTLLTRKTGYDKVSSLKEKSNTSLAVGIFFLLFFMLIIGIFIYILWKRNWVLPDKFSEIKTRSHDLVQAMRERLLPSKDSILKDRSHVDTSCVEDGEVAISMSHSANSQRSLIQKKNSHAMRVEDFPSYYHQATKINGNLGDEFQKLCSAVQDGEESSSYVGSSAQNVHLNQSSKALPFDRNRLCLVPDCDGANDYINATLLSGLKGGPCIVTQAPLPLTIPHFWRAVWDFKVTHIVMLLGPEESSKAMPEYWPEKDEDRLEGQISIKLIDEETYAYYSIRSFELCRRKQNEIRYVRHFQYRCWKPSGVPKNTIGFLDFMRRCQKNTDPSDAYMIHCQCGTGRSGLFLAIELLADECKRTGIIDIWTCVQDLHGKRQNLVKNVSQYKFLHEAMAEILGHEEDAIPVNEITTFYHNLTHVMQGNKVNLRREFEKMIAQTQTFTTSSERFLSPAKMSVNGHIMKLIKSLPQYKVLFVDSYKVINFFMVGNHPSESHLSEFWSLLMSTHCHTIIRISNMEESTHPIIPDVEQTKPYAMFSVTNDGSHQILEDLIEHRLKVQDNGDLNQSPMEIALLDVVWPGTAVAPHAKTLAEIESIVTNRSLRNSGKVMVVEKPGTGNGGLVCISLYLMEMVDTQGEVDVFRSVKHVRSQVPDAITLEDEYRFCYKMVKEYTKFKKPNLSAGKSHLEETQELAPPPWKSPFPVHTSTPKWHHMGDISIQCGRDLGKECQKCNDGHNKSSSISQGKDVNGSAETSRRSHFSNGLKGQPVASPKVLERTGHESPQTHPQSLEMAETTLSSREKDWREILRAASRLRRMSGGYSGEAFSPSKSADQSLKLDDLNNGEVKEKHTITADSPKTRAKGAGKPYKIAFGEESADGIHLASTQKVRFDIEVAGSPSKKRRERLEKIGKALPVVGGHKW